MTVYKLKCNYCSNNFKTIGKPHQKFCSISCGCKGKDMNIIDNDVFKNGWNPINSYLAGMIWSDGNLSFSKGGTPKISIYSRDENHIKKLFLEFGSNRRIYNMKNWQGNYGHMIYSSSLPDYSFLKNSGLIPNKSLTINEPLGIISFSKYFILGFFDGDGSVSLTSRKNGIKKYISITFTTGSRNLKDWIRNTLTINNINSTEWIDGRCGNPDYTLNDIYTISVSSKKDNVKRFFDLMYSDLSVPYMERKYQKFLEYFSQ